MKRALTRWKTQEARIAIQKSKRIYHTDSMDIRIGSSEQSYSRILVVTSRKSGNAVKRNLFRRRVKALFFEYNLEQGKNNWIIFAKPGIAQESFASLQKIFYNLAETFAEPL